MRAAGQSARGNQHSHERHSRGNAACNEDISKDYPISIGGVSLGATIGASKADFVGDVLNLSAPEDIEGVYSGAEAGLAIAGGAKTAILKNSKGVELKVSGEQMGLELTLDLNGMSVSLKK